LWCIFTPDDITYFDTDRTGKCIFADNTRIMVIRPRKMDWAEHVTRMVCMEIHAEFWSENLKKRDYLEDQEVYYIIIKEKD
jgi:hypothetical protein